MTKGLLWFSVVVGLAFAPFAVASAQDEQSEKAQQKAYGHGGTLGLCLQKKYVIFTGEVESIVDQNNSGRKSIVLKSVRWLNQPKNKERTTEVFIPPIPERVRGGFGEYGPWLEIKPAIGQKLLIRAWRLPPGRAGT